MSHVRDAATVIVLRDRAGGPEALMVRRHGKSGFAADAWVFPGGVIDPADAELPPDRWDGIDPGVLSARFGDPAGLVLARHVAAVRETFEEAGILLARHRDGSEVDLDDPEVQSLRNDWRIPADLVLDLGALTYWSRWITPRIEPKRYDTSFFLARAPEGQVADHDRVEITDQRWSTPAAALAAHRADELHMIYPTIRNLEEMTGKASVDELVAYAEGRPQIPRVIPHFAQTAEGWRVLHPDDPGFPLDEYAEELG
jgi:8-oxo-dGTP pyrophosphatase MutT (NUDIX family)